AVAAPCLPQKQISPAFGAVPRRFDFCKAAMRYAGQEGAPDEGDAAPPMRQTGSTKADQAKISSCHGGVQMRRACFAALFAAAGFLLANPARLEAQSRVAIDADAIGGVVTGPHGPEAGVWVIAETRELPTRYAKMVVTDDQGRYVVPD